MRPAHMPTGLDYDHLLSLLGSTRNDEEAPSRARLERLQDALAAWLLQWRQYLKDPQVQANAPRFGMG